VYLLAGVLPVPVPLGVVTATLKGPPAACAAVVAVICVSLVTVKEVTGAPSIVTAVAPVKYWPLMVTWVPPAVLPLFGLIADTVGDGAW
jgi:hypothetical protein